MNFSFAKKTLGSTTSTTSFVPLAANKIHDVTFQGISFAVSQSGQYEFFRAKYNAVSPEVGTHTITLFPPKSDERKPSSFGVNPSEEETFMLIVLHILQGLSEELAMNVATGTIAPREGATFKQLVEWLEEITKPFIGAKHQLKLIQNSKGEPAIPGFPTRVNPDTNLAEIKVNFIGPVLVFTNYELKKIQEAASATPTAAPTVASSFSLDSNTPSILDSAAGAPAAIPTAQIVDTTAQTSREPLDLDFV